MNCPGKGDKNTEVVGQVMLMRKHSERLSLQASPMREQKRKRTLKGRRARGRATRAKREGGRKRAKEKGWGSKAWVAVVNVKQKTRRGKGV